MTFIHPLIDPVILSFGLIQIRWYSLAYIFGLVIGYFAIKKLNNLFSKPLKKKVIDDSFLWIAFGVIIGGRLGYVIFYQPYIIFENFFYIFYIWQGGMSFHGGLVGVIIAILIYSKINKINFFQLSDLVSVVAPIGLFMGRIANFINTELYGRITEFPIAIIYPNIDLSRRHPSQIYEALLEGFILFIIMYINCKKNFKFNNCGIISSLFLIYYGFFRFMIEFVREPDIQLGLLFDKFSMGQILCIPMLIIGVLMYFSFLKKTKYDK